MLTEVCIEPRLTVAFIYCRKVVLNSSSKTVWHINGLKLAVHLNKAIQTKLFCYNLDPTKLYLYL